MRSSTPATPGASTRRAAPISTALGVLGMPGFTAYAGLLELGRPKAGETVVVAAAAGPVGSSVGQIARIKGARAVGIAGGPDKCRVLLEELGFDAAVDHRSPTFVEDLAAATPDGIDVYFENVGGPVFEAVVHRLNRFARIPVCGLIARYNDTEVPIRHRPAARLHAAGADAEPDRARVHPGRVRADPPRGLPAGDGRLGRDGSVRYREDVVEGLERAPEAFRGLLRGSNLGKMLVRVGDDPTLR